MRHHAVDLRPPQRDAQRGVQKPRCGVLVSLQPAQNDTVSSQASATRARASAANARKVPPSTRSAGAFAVTTRRPRPGPTKARIRPPSVYRSDRACAASRRAAGTSPRGPGSSRARPRGARPSPQPRRAQGSDSASAFSSKRARASSSGASDVGSGGDDDGDALPSISTASGPSAAIGPSSIPSPSPAPDEMGRPTCDVALNSGADFLGKARRRFPKPRSAPSRAPVGRGGPRHGRVRGGGIRRWVAGRLLVRRRAAGGSGTVPGCAEERALGAGRFEREGWHRLERWQQRSSDGRLGRRGASGAFASACVRATRGRRPPRALCRRRGDRDASRRPPLRTREISDTDPTDAPYLDFSVKSPWERASGVVETAARSWLRLTDKELRERSMVNDSGRTTARETCGFCVWSCPRTTKRRAKRAPIPSPCSCITAKTRGDPNVLYVAAALEQRAVAALAAPPAAENEPKTKPTKPARSRTNVSCVSHLATCAPEDDLSPGASGLQRPFGAGGANRRAFRGGGAPVSAGFAARRLRERHVRGRGRGDGGEGGGRRRVLGRGRPEPLAGVRARARPGPAPLRRLEPGTTTAFSVQTAKRRRPPKLGLVRSCETDSLESVAAERAHARTVHGLCDVLRAQLAALHGVQTADALVADAKVTARLAFVLGRTRESRRRRIESDRIESSSPPLGASGSSGESSDASSGASSSDGERGDIRAGEAFLAVAGGAAPRGGAAVLLVDREKRRRRRKPR